ncbi:MAG: hypothetical protein ABIX28_23550 [Vicinamibacterales bacterium]
MDKVSRADASSVAQPRDEHGRSGLTEPLAAMIAASEDDQELYAAGLSQCGFRTVCVEPRGVRASISAVAPAVIVLHLGLPENVGWRICETLLRDPVCAPIPLIVLTAAIRPDGRNRSKARGFRNCAAFVAKPCDPQNLARVIRIGLSGDRGVEFMSGQLRRLRA